MNLCGIISINASRPNNLVESKSADQSETGEIYFAICSVQAIHCGIVIIGLVDNDTEGDASSSLVELGEALDGYLKLQFSVLDNFLQQHAFDR